MALPIRQAAGALTIAASLSASQAQACRMYAPLRHEDVRHADVVVLGRIVDYRMILDPIARRTWRDHVARLRERDPTYRDTIRPKGFLTDHARFTIIVDQVLMGKAERRLAVTWNNSTFGEPETMAPGPYLIALQRPGSPLPPLRGPSGFIPARPDSGALTPLQAPCSGAFLFPDPGEDAARVRALLRQQPGPIPAR